MPSIDTEAIRAALPLATYAAHVGIPLRRSGGILRGPCPLCDSKSRQPFCVTGSRFTCHVCNARGDVIALCQGIEQSTFREAAQKLAALAGLDLADPAAQSALKTAYKTREAMRARQATKNQQSAEAQAARYWQGLPHTTPDGLAYLQRRGVARAIRDVRFTQHHVCLPIRQLDGRITNVVRRRIGPGEPKVFGLRGCTTRGTFGYPLWLPKTTGPIIIVEGVFDWLSARVLAPDRLILGAHGAGQLPGVVRMVAQQCGSRGLIFVPHKDDNKTGQRQVDKAIAAAIEQGISNDRIRIFDVGPECNDLNDYLVSRGSTEGVPLDAAPTLTEIENRRCFPLTDAGNAARFAHTHSQCFRYVTDMGKWLRWSGKTWDCANERIELVRAAIEVTDHIERVAVITEPTDAQLATKLRDHGRKTQSEARLSAMTSLARAMPELAATLDQLDRDPFLLAADNGTIDLRTGKLRPHRRDDLLTARSPVVYDPDAKCPRWDRFLAEVFEPNPDAAVFVQRFAGYSLTGDTSAQCLLFAHGGGANGKGVLFRTIEKLLGSTLSASAPFDTFVEKRHGDAPFFALAGFRGKRAIFVSEGNQRDRLAEGLIKQITGGDRISARFLHGQFFEYRPALKLWMCSNHLPQIRGNDRGMWRRFKLVPFEVSFEDRRDDQLEDRLDQELPGILAWAVRGCQGWLGDGGGIRGLGESVSVAEATAAYRSDSDHVGRFLEECCVVHVEGARTKTTAVYGAYKRWAECEGQRPLSSAQLGRELKQRGFAAEKGNRARFYPVGLAVDQPSD